MIYMIYQICDKDDSWIDPWNKKSEYQEKRRQTMLGHNVKIWTIHEVNEFINGNHKILYE